MANITINIKNCGCGCGESSGKSGGVIDVPYNELGDPTGLQGPPYGYLEPGLTISDRQCKMAVWLYDWLEAAVDMLGNTGYGTTILTGLRFARTQGSATVLAPIIAAGIGLIIAQITPGFIIDDLVLPFLSGGLAYTMIAAASLISTEFITQPTLQTALPIIQALQNDIICQLASATSGADARARLEQVLEPQLTFEQSTLVYGWIPDMLLTMLFYTADWWPSFDDDVLSGITATCCGDYVDGQPITQGSVQECQASYFVIDQLAAMLVEAGSQLSVWEAGTGLNKITLYSDQQDIYQAIDASISLPRKGKQLMTSYQAFLDALANVFYNRLTVWNTLINGSESFDPGYGDLAAEIIADRAGLSALIRGTADQNAAFTALYSELTDWIDSNITDTTEATYMKQSLAAIITPTNRDDWMDLLFLQDSDLLQYGNADCGTQGGACETLLYGSGSYPNYSAQNQGGYYQVNVAYEVSCELVPTGLAVSGWTKTNYSGNNGYDVDILLSDDSHISFDPGATFTIPGGLYLKNVNIRSLTYFSATWTGV